MLPPFDRGCGSRPHIGNDMTFTIVGHVCPPLRIQPFSPIHHVFALSGCGARSVCVANPPTVASCERRRPAWRQWWTEVLDERPRDYGRIYMPDKKPNFATAHFSFCVSDLERSLR